MSVIAAGSLVAATSAPAGAQAVHPSFHLVPGGVTLKPAAGTVGYANNQKITVSFKGFTGDTEVFMAECAATVVSKGSAACDTTNLVDIKNVKGGKGHHTFTIHSGASFKPTDPTAKCGYKLKACLILVADNLTISKVNNVAFGSATFKGVVTHVKVTSKKTIKVGKTLLFRAVTTHAKGTGLPTGKVTFKANNKKFKSVNEPKSGKVSAKHKFTKAGTYHITVTYAGNKVYGKSVGKETIHVKA